jgi:hypothetical protein
MSFQYSPTLIRVLQSLTVAQLNDILIASKSSSLPMWRTVALCNSCSGVDGAWLIGYSVEQPMGINLPPIVIANIVLTLDANGGLTAELE